MLPEQADSWDALEKVGRRRHVEMTAARHWEKLDELEREEFGALLPEQADSWDALAQVGHRQHVEIAARH